MPDALSRVRARGVNGHPQRVAPARKQVDPDAIVHCQDGLGDETGPGPHRRPCPSRHCCIPGPRGVGTAPYPPSQVSAAADTIRIGWPDIVRLADQHPGLSVGRWGVAAARGAADAAGTLPNPSLDATITRGEAAERLRGPARMGPRAHHSAGLDRAAPPPRARRERAGGRQPRGGESDPAGRPAGASRALLEPGLRTGPRGRARHPARPDRGTRAAGRPGASSRARPGPPRRPASRSNWRRSPANSRRAGSPWTPAGIS